MDAGDNLRIWEGQAVFLFIHQFHIAGKQVAVSPHVSGTVLTYLVSVRDPPPTRIAV